MYTTFELYYYYYYDDDDYYNDYYYYYCRLTLLHPNDDNHD